MARKRELRTECRQPVIIKSQRVMYCGRCGFVGSFVPKRFTKCWCGNMAARYESATRGRVEVIAIRKGFARIMETNELLQQHFAALLKVGDVPEVRWSPVLQKKIDKEGKLVTDFVRAKKPWRRRQAGNRGNNRVYFK